MTFNELIEDKGVHKMNNLTMQCNGNLEHSNANLSKSNTSGHKGVYKRYDKWTAQIVYQSKTYYLGSFNSIEEAVAVREFAEKYTLNDFYNWFTEYKNSYYNSKYSKTNSSGHKGVHKNKYNTYTAHITYQSKGYYLGSFNNIEEAIAVRKMAEKNIHNDFHKWVTEYKNSYISYFNAKLSKTNASGHKGIYKNRYDKWTAQIAYQNKGYYLGAFNSIQEAIEVRKIAENHIISNDFDKWVTEYKKNQTMVNSKHNQSINNKLSKANTSGYKGVYKNINNTYTAQIAYHKKGYNLGSFNSIDEAIAVRKMAENHIISNNFDKWVTNYKKSNHKTGKNIKKK